MKRMQHPQHGFHHPINSLERESMIANGWADEEPPAEPEPEAPEAASEVPAKRRGRPPKVAQ